MRRVGNTGSYGTELLGLALPVPHAIDFQIPRREIEDPNLSTSAEQRSARPTPRRSRGPGQWRQMKTGQPRKSETQPHLNLATRRPVQESRGREGRKLVTEKAGSRHPLGVIASLPNVRTLGIWRGVAAPPFEPPTAGRARPPLPEVDRLIPDHLHRAAVVAHRNGNAVSARYRRCGLLWARKPACGHGRRDHAGGRCVSGRRGRPR